jgi:starch synthase
MDKKRILFLSQEIFPFLPKNELSYTTKRVSQGIQDLGKEIRIFSPKYGSINERRHQLHEVIRLSGMNIVIDDQDHSLIIKVASVPNAKMQVYFIDNEEFFNRKHTVTGDDGSYFDDNDKRSIFFCRGVLETVKKLGWQPDVIHCHGWLGLMMPLYIKKVYNQDPHFENTKVVLSLFDLPFNDTFDPKLEEILKFDGILEDIGDSSFENVLNCVVKYSDGITVLSENISDACQRVFDAATCQKMTFVSEEHQNKHLSEFFDKVIEETVVS